MNFNTKVSGAKSVLVPIKGLGKNYFPFVDDLRDRHIKYIDYYPTRYLPDVEETGCEVLHSMYLTLADKVGNAYLVNNMPLERYCYIATLGQRQVVGTKLSLQNCYVECQNAAAVGTYALFVFWYDLPEFSAKNRTDHTQTDALIIPLVSSVRHNTFPDEERMSLKRFRSVLLGTPETMPDLTAGLTEGQLRNMYITLRKGSFNVMQDVPLWLFNQLRMVEKTEFANVIFDLQQSFLTIGGVGTIPNVETDYIGKSVYLNLVYEK